MPCWRNHPPCRRVRESRSPAARPARPASQTCCCSPAATRAPRSRRPTAAAWRSCCAPGLARRRVRGAAAGRGRGQGRVAVAMQLAVESGAHQAWRLRAGVRKNPPAVAFGFQRHWGLKPASRPTNCLQAGWMRAVLCPTDRTCRIVPRITLPRRPADAHHPALQGSGARTHAARPQALPSSLPQAG